MPKAKYATPEHRAARRALERQMKRDGHLVCVEPICLMSTRVITPGQTWHVCHTPDGTRITGPGHSRCNTSEGATRGNKMRGRRPRRWIL